MFLVKAAVFVAVVWWLGKKVYEAWRGAAGMKVVIDWRWGALSILGFCGSMITSALVWRWLAYRMGERGAEKKLPTLPLVGAYTFSQMGKYVPGKVALVLMRIDRARRFGMSAGTCTLSTLVENALYIASGGLCGMLAIFRILDELRAQKAITELQQHLAWPIIIVALAGILVLCHPTVLYGVLNRAITRMKREPIPPERRPRFAVVLGAVIGFLPCWLCGGLALWASSRSVYPLDLSAAFWFSGAYALSVIIGMVSLLPGGLGVREAVLGAAVAIQLSPAVGHDNAVKLAAAAAGLQRLFQIGAELLLGAAGAALTSRRNAAEEHQSERKPAAESSS
ncbi:MAG TPA: lysylphosphatidylglycerol synthase transmembrane domain-containing protein [Phycisphaerae bacterium]|nr:lysylphosphatidylglycerol synthase transmembrane domain-containing protein [Phycisphaerae bacterium]